MNMSRLLGGLLFGCACAGLGCGDTVSPAAALVTGEKGVNAIAVDDFYLYWTTEKGDVKRISLDGGHPETIVSGEKVPSQIAIDDDSVYWANQEGAVMRADKSGSTPLMIAQESSLRGLAVDGENVYFTADQADGGALKRAPKGGGDVTVLVDKQSEPGPIQRFGGEIYWANAGVKDGDGEVLRITPSSVDPTSVVAGVSRPNSISVSSLFVYWASFGAGTVNIATVDGNNPHAIASDQNLLHTVIGDDFGVYWTGLDGTLSAVSTYGGEPAVIGVGTEGMVSLATDGTFLYWANAKDGSIIVMPKPQL
jgi:hypothetical protein